uniref:Uncharacterized protein n=1 Tax=Moniliophthora roreri TaxID=221103 RepID=A0A0W0GAJ1_MONRR
MLQSLDLKSLPGLGQIAGKYILLLVFLLNFRAFPFVWHFRIFRPVFRIWADIWLIRLKNLLLLRSAKQKHAAIEAYFDQRSPVGINLLEYESVWRSFASVDESDYNLHLSNSSYAKTLDGARFKAACDLFPHFLRAGGRIALGGTSFSFLKEIPILSRYEVRVAIRAWDTKWMYIICKFVTKNSNKSSRKPTHTTATPSSSAAFINDTSPGLSTAPTPLPATSANPNPNLDSVDAKLNKLPSEVEEGYTLHTISISEMCFKIGRITVPPAVVFATNGLASSPSSTQTYQKVKEMLGNRGGLRKLRELYKGGWKEPEWKGLIDGAFASVDGLVKERAAVLSGVKRGLEGAKVM